MSALLPDEFHSGENWRRAATVDYPSVTWKVTSTFAVPLVRTESTVPRAAAFAPVPPTIAVTLQNTTSPSTFPHAVPGRGWGRLAAAVVILSTDRQWRAD